jgi:hypothetical protein
MYITNAWSVSTLVDRVMFARPRAISVPTLKLWTKSAFGTPNSIKMASSGILTAPENMAAKTTACSAWGGSTARAISSQKASYRRRKEGWCTTRATGWTDPQYRCRSRSATVRDGR